MSLESSCKKQSKAQVVDTNQMCIEVGFERASTNDISQLYIAGLEMVIADFFCCENIQDNVVKSFQFKRILQQARLVRKECNIKERNKIGGKFLCLVYDFIFIIIIFCFCFLFLFFR